MYKAIKQGQTNVFRKIKYTIHSLTTQLRNARKEKTLMKKHLDILKHILKKTLKHISQRRNQNRNFNNT